MASASLLSPLLSKLLSFELPHVVYRLADSGLLPKKRRNFRKIETVEDRNFYFEFKTVTKYKIQYVKKIPPMVFELTNNGFKFKLVSMIEMAGKRSIFDCFNHRLFQSSTM